MIDKEVFSKILQNHLESKEEKPGEFAKRVNIPLSTIRSYVTGATAPSFNVLSVVSKDMGLTLEQLLRLGDPAVSGLDEVKDIIASNCLRSEELKELAVFVIEKI